MKAASPFFSYLNCFIGKNPTAAPAACGENCELRNSVKTARHANGSTAGRFAVWHLIIVTLVVCWLVLQSNNKTMFNYLLLFSDNLVQIYRLLSMTLGISEFSPSPD